MTFSVAGLPEVPAGVVAAPALPVVAVAAPPAGAVVDVAASPPAGAVVAVAGATGRVGVVADPASPQAASSGKSRPRTANSENQRVISLIMCLLLFSIAPVRGMGLTRRAVCVILH